MSSPKSRLEAVMASAPLNGTAGRVTSGGYHWEPPKHKTLDTHADCPAIRPVPPTSTREIRALPGFRYGRMTVVGLSADRPKRWVVRCVCGRYTFRTARAIRQVWIEEDRCGECDALRSINWAYENKGPKPINEFLAQCGRSPEGQDRASGLDAKRDHAVAEGEAP